MTEEAIKEAEKELQVQGETSLSEETTDEKTEVSEEKIIQAELMLLMFQFVYNRNNLIFYVAY